jgi:tetratricopeptide (TPR) repeat protein
MEEDKIKKIEEAEKHKENGNNLFKEKKYEEAILEYTKAIEICPNSLYYSNLAICNLNLENYGEALIDCRGMFVK